MKPLQPVPLTDREKALLEREPVKRIEFSCGRCGGSLFFAYWSVYGDHSGATFMNCASCDLRVMPMEPKVNGPH